MDWTLLFFGGPPEASRFCHLWSLWILIVWPPPDGLVLVAKFISKVSHSAPNQQSGPHQRACHARPRASFILALSPTCPDGGHLGLLDLDLESGGFHCIMSNAPSSTSMMW